MPRGRPVRSTVRQNLVELLSYMKRGYGYDIAKLYNRIFPKVTMRLVYYHLRKGVDLGEFRLEGIEREKGSYSWGDEVEKKYYAVGPNANVRGNDRVNEYWESKKSESASA